MTYIPDCRNPKEINFKGEVIGENAYYEGNLSDRDKEFVRGFDYCVDYAADNFFDNLITYYDRDSYLIHILNEELPRELKDSYEVEIDGQTFTRDVETYKDLFRKQMLDWIEMQRDELITSMIDNAAE